VSEAELRAAVVESCRAMNAAGINQGTSGNVSARYGDGFLITPSGVPYDALTPEAVVVVTFDGDYAGGLRPSSEWRMHADILAARPDAEAIVHTHSTFCTTLACLRRDIPPFHYMIAVAGGATIRCADYATFGTAELAANAVRALEGRNACLLANHGMICLGPSLAKTLALAVEVETLARQYWHASLAGEPVLLSEEEMRRVLEKFRTYGQQGRS